MVRFETPQLTLRLVRSSGTVAELEPKPEQGEFDFAPAELLAARSTDGYYHLGNLDLRLRQSGQTDRKGYSAAWHRNPVHMLAPRPGELLLGDRPRFKYSFGNSSQACQV